MAYVLSLRPHSPLKRSFSDSPYLQSYSPPKDLWMGALADASVRNASACSMYPARETRPEEYIGNNENMLPTSSQSALVRVPHADDLAWDLNLSECMPCKNHHLSVRQPRLRARVMAPSDPYSRRARPAERASESIPSPRSLEDITGFDWHKDDVPGLLSLYEAARIPLTESNMSEHTKVGPTEPNMPTAVTVSTPLQPFRRWMSTLRRRHAQHWKQHEADLLQSFLPAQKEVEEQLLPETGYADPVRRFSESMSSSMAIVTTVKSASVTAASISIAPQSNLCQQSFTHISKRGSNFSEARRSAESCHGCLLPIIDESAWLRSIQRRKVVEELISSEESYIADLKVLINDYFVILTTLPTIPSQTKSSIQQNISQILQLHEDLLADLHQIVPRVDFDGSAHHEASPLRKARHTRFHSADVVPGRLTDHKVARRLRHSLDIARSPNRRLRGLATDTHAVRDIARAFNKHMKRFFTYEEYGAHWTTMSQDLTDTCKGLHGWQDYERGVEALQKIVASDNNRDLGSKKALSFADLLIKPIQRVCKYPLLFDDLCRHTPVYDDPEAHSELEKALFRLQETIREVNKAKDDPKTRRLIEITWHLQDRLLFPEQTMSKALAFRLLGHVLLCGVLHVTFQTPEPRIKGQYMICVLYKSCLILATSSRFQSTYTVVASIGLANSSIEEPGNGRGVQCHTAPHTWKLVFENGHRLHEVIFSACSSLEEEAWRTQLRERSLCETQDYVEGHSAMQDIFSTLNLAFKSLGPVFGHADSLVRRMSVHRAATLGAKPSMCQVIIKNTQSQKNPDLTAAFSPNTMNRSQSHMSANHIPTLAPRRMDRIRLENLLEDVWTKDLLPFPGMSSRKVEHQIRASATSVMRKLSMASIASNFSRRSPSFSSVSNARSEDSIRSRVHRISHGNLRPRSATDKRPAPTVVDFHTAPAAFLPIDFELEESRPLGRRRRLANRTTDIERSGDNKNSSRPARARGLSMHSMNLPQPESSGRVVVQTTSDSSEATILRHVKPVKDPKKSPGTGKLKRRDNKASYTNGDSSTMLTSSKFIRTKSRIFRFWT